MLRQTAARSIGLRALLASQSGAQSALIPAASKLGESISALTQTKELTFQNTSRFTTTSAAWKSAQPALDETDTAKTELNIAQDATVPVAPHPNMKPDVVQSQKQTYWLMQPVYTKDYVESIVPKHNPPVKFHDYTGYYAVQTLRSAFDLATGYGSQMNEKKWLARFIYLETVAGVPGMVGAMLRHLRSLRAMSRDHGWIHTLLEEAENERMHLLTFLQLRQPGPVFRAAVLGGQAVFLALYSFFYAISPRHCHSFVGYLEEEAVKTYTRALDDYDSGRLPEWKDRPAPQVAIKYWKLGENATMRDVLLAVRADEACHQHVNATFAALKPTDKNPFAPGTTIVE